LHSESEATVTIIDNLPPVADAGPPPWYGGGDTYFAPAGQYVQLDASASYEPDGDFLYWDNFTWDLDGDGVYGEYYGAGGERGDEHGYYTYFLAYDLQTTADYPVSLKVTDYDGLTNTDTATVHVFATAPVARIFGAPTTTPEGSAVTLEGAVDGRGGDDNNGLTFAWTVTKDGSPYLTGDERLLTFIPQDEGTYQASLVVTSAAGPSDSTGLNNVTFAVTNAAPRLNDLHLDAAAIDAGGTVTLSGSYNDLGPADAHAVTINWGDGTTETLNLAPAGDNLPVSGSRQFNGHTYYGVLGGRLPKDD